MSVNTVFVVARWVEAETILVNGAVRDGLIDAEVLAGRVFLTHRQTLLRAPDTCIVFDNMADAITLLEALKWGAGFHAGVADTIGASPIDVVVAIGVKFADAIVLVPSEKLAQCVALTFFVAEVKSVGGKYVYIEGPLAVTLIVTIARFG